MTLISVDGTEAYTPFDRGRTVNIDRSEMVHGASTAMPHVTLAPNVQLEMKKDPSRTAEATHILSAVLVEEGLRNCARNITNNRSV